MSGRQRLVLVIVLLLLIVSAVGSVVARSPEGRLAGGGPPQAGAAPTDALEAHFIDVGQGDATLLRTATTAMLIDTGRHDGDEALRYLERLGVERLDLVVVTHPHADHLGQLDRIMEAVAVDEVWWSGAVHTTRTFERAVEALERSSAAYAEPRTGDRTRIGDLDIEVVHPPSAGWGSLNDGSLALRVTYGSARFLFTGDAEAAAEGAMLAAGAQPLAADVLQLGHHGSSTSTGEAFLDAVRPTIAVYSAGAGNPYGHPHREVVERLEARGATLYGTDVHGTIVLVSDGDAIELQSTERGVR